jgi:hypothetical protein
MLSRSSCGPVLYILGGSPQHTRAEDTDRIAGRNDEREAVVKDGRGGGRAGGSSRDGADRLQLDSHGRPTKQILQPVNLILRDFIYERVEQLKLPSGIAV